MLSKADHARIAEAVGAAEARTSGEILCVLSHKVSDYREVPLAWGAAAALALPALGTVFGLHSWLASRQGGDWAATNAAALDVSIREALTGYALVQTVIFAFVAALLAISVPLKLALTPRSLKRKRVRRAAMHHLAATRLLGAGAAVVIFASEQERMVTVAADEAIHLKAGDAAWDAAVTAALSGIKAGDPTAGFVRAVEICGGYLAEHFPSDGTGRHVIADGLLEI